MQITLGLVVALAIALAGQEPPPSPQPANPAGRVVVTITVLEGTVRMSGVDVQLRSLDGNVVLARTISDGAGQVTFPDVPAGRYVVDATRPGFVPTASAEFVVRGGETSQVLVDLQLTFVAPGVEVRAPATPTRVCNPSRPATCWRDPSSTSRRWKATTSKACCRCCQALVRGPDGRLRAKGGQPTQAALQISSASLIDPSSGDFDLELPGQSLESVEVLANPFAAEYGRFSTAVVQLRTQRGTNDWEIKPGNLVPRFRRGLRGVRGFEPRFSVRGPLKRDRLFLAQDVQFRYVNDPVRSLPGEPRVQLTSFDSFTRVDGVLSPRHTLGALVVLFPRKIEHLTMNTFRPPEVTPEFNQSGTSVGVQDRFAMSPTMVLESTVAARGFEVNVNTDGREPMIYTPETQQGSFFNDQEREVKSVQWIETLSVTLDKWRGTHLFKFGFDFQDSGYDGTSVTRPVEIRRLDGTLAERIEFSGPATQNVTAAELAVFAQDRWRLGSRVTLELGYSHGSRGRDRTRELVSARRRVGGRIARRTRHSPWRRGQVPAANTAERRRVLRLRIAHRDTVWTGRAAAWSTRVVREHPGIRPAHAGGVAGNVEWNQRFGRRVLIKANYLRRKGSHEYILEPDASIGEVRLSSTGTSRYWEAELTGRYLVSERRDLTVSYVRSHGTADLNNYDQFYGNRSQPDRARERAQSDSHRRAASGDRARHHRPAGSVGHRTGDRGSFGVPVLGG